MKRAFTTTKKSLEYSTKFMIPNSFTKLNITWAYFDIGRYDEGYPYLQYVNKYHEKYVYGARNAQRLPSNFFLSR
jgi:hypothetical protein